MPHGILFMLYIILAFMLRADEKWGNSKTKNVLIASVIPFGTFYIENKYFRKKA